MAKYPKMLMRGVAEHLGNMVSALGVFFHSHPPSNWVPRPDKRSYTGPMTLFGKSYQANYAPLIGADGKTTGALFVGVAK